MASPASLQSGMYVFFLENPYNQQGQSRAGCVRLGNDGPGQPVYLSSSKVGGLGRGIAAAKDTNNIIHVFVADASRQIWEMLFDGDQVTGASKVDGAMTDQDMSAIIGVNGTMELFFVDGSTGYVARKVNGAWNKQDLQLDSVVNGVSAHLWNGELVLAYQSNSNNTQWQLVVQSGYGANKRIISPPSGYLVWWTPRMTVHGMDLFLGWHSADVSNQLYSAQRSGNAWSGQAPAPQCVFYESPALCAFDRSVFCFTQGNGNQIYYQVYICGSWIEGLNVLTGAGGVSLGNIWYSPSILVI